MKLSTTLLAVLSLFACSLTAAPAKPAASAPAPAAAPKASVKLQLPPEIYAVPGVESCIYFDNVVNVINPDNYVFDVECPKGRNDQKRWRYTPKAGEKGTYTLKLTV